MGAAAGGVFQMFGAVAQSNATIKAAEKQAIAAGNAQQQQWNMYQQQRTDAAPWRNTGGAAMQQLGWLMGLPGGVGISASDMPKPQWVDKDGKPLPANLLNPSEGTLMGAALLHGINKKDQDAIWKAYFSDMGAHLQTPDEVVKYNGGTSGGFQGNPADFGAFNKSFGMSDFQADPGYQFRMDEAMKALNRSAASRGQLFSGGTLKDLQNYSQGLASQEYGNAYNRFNNDRSQRFNQLAALAGIGQTANGQLMQGGMNAANNMSNATLQAGNAASAAAAAQGNIWGNFANNMGNYWQQWAQMNNGGGSSGGGMPNWSNGSGGWGNSGDIRDNENGGWWD